MEDPFNCFKMQAPNMKLDPKELELERLGDNRYHHVEKQITAGVGSSIQGVARAAGVRQFNWLSFTKWLLYI
jgi:hypothetical protein